MSKVDIAIIVVIGLMMLSGYIRGFIKTLFNVVSMIITFGLTYYLYPYVSKFIMNETSLYKNISETISSNFDFEKLLEGAITKESQLQAIENLPLPDMFKEILVNNNNPEMFKLLDVSSFQDYISGSLASIVVNIIVFIALFFIIWIVLNILVSVLDLVAKLPGLKQVNKLAGAGLGLVFGLAFVFIGLAVVTLIISVDQNLDLVQMVENSYLGGYLYNHNPIMEFLNNNVDNTYFWNIISRD